MINDLKSVGLKFLLLLLPPLFVTAAIVSASFSFSEFRTMREAFTQKQGTVIDFHTAVLASPLFNRDGDNVQRILELLSLDPEIASARVSNRIGQVIARIENARAQTDDEDFTISKKIFFSSAVASVDDLEVGTLSVTFRDNVVEQALFDRAIRDFLFVGILSLALVSVAYLAGRRVFVTPLQEFLSAIQVAQDRISREPLEVRTRDEIGGLVSAYNDLLAKLEEEERERERSARLYRLLAEHTNDSIALRTLTGDYFYYSPSSVRISGFPMDELLALGDINNLVHPDDLPMVEQRRKDMEAGKADLSQPMIFRFVKKDGDVRWAEAKVTIIPGLENPEEPNVMTAIHDVTDIIEKQKELEESQEELKAQTGELRALADQFATAKSDLENANKELERNSRLFKVLADNAQDSISLRKIDGDYFYYSPSSKRVSGYDMEELFELGDIKYLLVPEDQKKVDDLRDNLASGKASLDEPLLLRMKRKDGEIRWLETTVSIVPGIDDPNEYNVMTASHDVTELIQAREEQKQLSEELERSSRLFRLLAENTNDFVAFRSNAGQYTYFSPQAEKYTGYTEEELYEKNTLMPLFHPDHHDRARELMEMMESDKEFEAGPVVWRFVRKQGDIRYNECTVTSMPNPEKLSEQGALLTFHDITDLIENQNALEESRDQMADLAKQLEEAKLAAEANLETIQQDIGLARAMQQAIVPRSFPSHPKFQVHAIMDAARQVGGDFYDFYQLDSRHLGVAIADVAGKGVPAAFFMAISRTLLETAARSNSSPAAVLEDVNQRLAAQNPLYLFITLFYGVLDIDTGVFVYSNGGHNPPFLLHADGTVDEIPITGDRMLGLVEDIEFQDREMELNDGDTLFLFTDGITEAVNNKLAMFGDRRLKKTLSACAKQSPEDIVSEVRSAMLDFAGDVEQADDLTCMAVTYNAWDDLSISKDTLRLKPELLDPKAVIELEMVNDIAQVSTLHEQLSQFMVNWGVSKEVQFQVKITLEEYVVNLITYGYQDDDRHMIHVTVSLIPDALLIEIFDDGAPFNPINAPEIDIDATIEDRQIGGLGIHIIRTYMDQLSYLSREGINRFIMTKVLG